MKLTVYVNVNYQWQYVDWISFCPIGRGGDRFLKTILLWTIQIQVIDKIQVAFNSLSDQFESRLLNCKNSTGADEWQKKKPSQYFVTPVE